ncbi:geranylgeranylglycerol-phosphate geranylgeranyltransferase [Aquimarina agarivorans]|uniref:geranylgeranylglycerol-phosphate geranylgeranyltransferase n=1 Tax=Aquimarina agarivorans TaxID=980584 RepID=UPI000248E6EB|nr:geranylgeranylglycerol-phosphate geranylgeranyltransferase [Aquimarina agarivorans]
MPNFSRKIKWFFYKSFSLLSVIRGYNVLVVLLAQYVTSIFILSGKNSFRAVLLDESLFCIVFASAITIASGYIINNFYDSEKDLINRPQKYQLDRLVSQQTKLTIYFIANFIAVIIASYVSFRAVLFFSGYIFAIWLYSHKLKRLLFIKNIVATFLAILPFFAIFLYYKNYDSVIFVHATFLGLIILMRELVKDLENLRGDAAVGNRTIPIVFGESASKKILVGLAIASIGTAMSLVYIFPLGKMYYFFWMTAVMLLLFGVLLKKASTKKQYVVLHNLLKFVIVTGVFCITLIELSWLKRLL